MEVTINRYSNLKSNPLESKKVTLIWGNDGWTYIPQLRIRQRFDDKYFLEKWDGIIATPEHIEEITWSLYSQAPRIWREQGEGFDQIFEQRMSNPNRNNHKTTIYQ